MKSPITGKEMKVVKELREMIFRKEKFPVVFHYFLCEDTGEQFEDDYFSALNYNQVVNQYRVNHHIPFPEQIREIRAKYDLSAARMSDILGLGVNSWRQYEAGEVPSKANATLIQMISKPETFEDYIQRYSELEDKERDKILKHIQKLKSPSAICYDPLFPLDRQPDINSGFKPFDREKARQLIIYFAEKLRPYKTKLNKLLFYADFMQFRKCAQSITGLWYQAIPYGPVPTNYDLLYGFLSERGMIEIDYVLTQNGEAERILPKEEHPFDASIFTTEELVILEFLVGRFKDTTAGEIAEISHREPAWKENIDNKRIIPYTYAFSLEMV